MSDIKNTDDSNDEDAFTDDGTLRAGLAESGFKPDANNMLHGKAQPKILVPGVRKQLQQAANSAGKNTSKGR